MLGMLLALILMIAVSCCSCARRRGGSTGGSGAFNSPRQRSTAWGTAETMRRKQRASSGCCSCRGLLDHVGRCTGLGVMVCYVTIALGTLFGGWRIVKTMGQRITKLKPLGGFCAETGGAATLFLATAFGIPVSTTHTLLAQSSASARRATSLRFVGASPEVSCGRGCSRSRAPHSLRRSPGGWARR